MDKVVVHLVPRGHTPEEHYKRLPPDSAVIILSGEPLGLWIVVIEDGSHQAVLVPTSSDAETIEREMREAWLPSAREWRRNRKPAQGV